MASSQTNYGGISFFGLLQIVFIVLKLYDYDAFRKVADEGKEYVFSVHPSLLSDARFVADMDSMYGEPCKYEMW